MYCYLALWFTPGMVDSFFNAVQCWMFTSIFSAEKIRSLSLTYRNKILFFVLASLTRTVIWIGRDLWRSSDPTPWRCSGLCLKSQCLQGWRFHHLLGAMWKGKLVQAEKTLLPNRFGHTFWTEDGWMYRWKSEKLTPPFRLSEEIEEETSAICYLSFCPKSKLLTFLWYDCCQDFSTYFRKWF